jgi:Carboxypeptidase regulatory-like domain
MAMLREREQLAARSAPAGLGAIAGSVVGFDGQPVAGACVTAVGSGRSITAAAAPDGTFRLAGLPAGSYALEYRDCAAAGRYLTTWSGGAVAQGTAARVQVAAGQMRDVPVVMLHPVNLAAAIAAQQASFRRELAASDRVLPAAAAAKTGEIAGKVTGKGKPLSGICVAALSVNGSRGYVAMTTKHGTYTVRDVAAGKYHVVFAGPFCPAHGNWLPQAYKNDNKVSAVLGGGGTAVRVRAGHKTTGINGNLRLGGEISGTVTSTSGARLRGICVAATGSSSHLSFGYGGHTAANGSYYLHALIPGKYTLQFTIGCGSHGGNYAPATRRAVKMGLGQDLTVNEKLARGASIAGKVTLGSAKGRPLAGMCVFASNTSGSVNEVAATNRDGHYRVIGLTGGSYLLDVSPGCNNNGNYTEVFVTAHTTAGKQTSGVNAVLQVGAEISGTITNTDDQPLTGICFEVVGNDSVSSYEGFDTAGSYVIDQLEAGTYQIGFYAGCGNRGSYAPDWYENQPSQNTATPITLATGQSFTANAVLQPGATITGRVTDAAGHGLSGICVAATAQSDAALGTLPEPSPQSRHGRYTLSNLAPGQYLISFGCGSSRRYGDQWFPSAPTPGDADLVSAPAGKTSGINAVLQPGGSISGVVTGKGGHPLAGVCVLALNTKGALPPVRGLVGLVGLVGPDEGGQLAVTGRHGTYRILGLTAGRYQVTFIPCERSFKYAEQWYRDKGTALAATSVTVRAGKSRSGIDGRLVLGGTISGRVTGTTANPLRNVCVVAVGQSGGPVGAAVTGRTGTFAIAGLSSDRYTVEFSPCGTQNLVTVVAHARVTAPHATTVDATMKPGGSIAGVVTAGSASGPPVSESCVEVYSDNSAQLDALGFTGLDGSYQASGLPAGTYQVYFGDPQCLLTVPGLAPQWYNDELTQAAATTVTVTVGHTTGSIDAALQSDGEITGTVSGLTATALSGACVTAIPVPAGGSLPVLAVTGSSGYTLGDLVPGGYKVRFSVGCGAVGYGTQWWDDVTSGKDATVIPVGPNDVVPDISATLSKSG